MNIPQEEVDRIERIIASDASPVGIDAKRTHIIIIHMLERMQKQLDEMDARLSRMENSART
jgi:hypothetical protein